MCVCACSFVVCLHTHGGRRFDSACGHYATGSLCIVCRGKAQPAYRRPDQARWTVMYLGGKALVAKRFAHVIDDALASQGGLFMEPFVGGYNVVPALSRVTEAFCSDVHPGLIEMYNALQRGWSPPDHISKTEYESLRSLRQADALSAFVSFACSFRGKEWGGYFNRASSDAARAAKRSLFKSLPDDRVTFSCTDFQYVKPARPAVVYCDPPYQGTTGYRTGAFDHLRFYGWCRAIASFGNRVFISEFSNPSGFRVIWSESRKITTSHGSRIQDELLLEVTP